MEWAKKENFFNAKVPVEELDVPDIGKVKVHGLVLGEKEQWEQNSFRFNLQNNQMKISHADAQLLTKTVYNQHGQRLFGEADMGRLLATPALILEPILETARRLSGIGKKAIEELVKNSQLAPEPKSEDSDTD